MAIAKVGKTGSSAGAINYVLSENKEATKQPEILAGSFGTMAEIKQEFEAYNKLNSRVKNQASHISVALSPGEHLKTEKKIEFAEKLLEKLDFKNVPYLVVEHFDKDYEHFHIIAGRIRDDGTTVKEWEIADRAIKATKVLEKEFGLKEVEYIKSTDRRVKIGEYKRMERANELSVMAEAKLTIDEILKNEPTVKDFVENLQQSGFEVRPNTSEKTGQMNGFSFKKDEIKFKSSAIAKNYSWQNLQKNGLNYAQTRDTEFLIGVKNEFTQKLNIEGRGDRAIETAKPAINSTKSVNSGTQYFISRTESNLEQVQSILKQELIRDTENVQNRNIEHPNHSGKSGTSPIGIIETFDGIARKSGETKLYKERYYNSGIREARTDDKINSEKSSRIGKSTDKRIETDLTTNESKLNPTPEREANKTNMQNQKREIHYDKGRDR